MAKTIYLAGPEIFAPNADELADNARRICIEYGFTPLHPSDEDFLPDLYSSTDIMFSNRRMISAADYVVANINFFRGQCIDDGTAWEIGYACGIGKKIFAYTSDTRSMREKIGQTDANGWTVEKYKSPVNLMIAESVVKIIKGDLRKCIAAVAKYDQNSTRAAN